MRALGKAVTALIVTASALVLGTGTAFARVPDPSTEQGGASVLVVPSSADPTIVTTGITGATVLLAVVLTAAVTAALVMVVARAARSTRTVAAA